MSSTLSGEIRLRQWDRELNMKNDLGGNLNKKVGNAAQIWRQLVSRACLGGGLCGVVYQRQRVGKMGGNDNKESQECDFGRGAGL